MSTPLTLLTVLFVATTISTTDAPTSLRPEWLEAARHPVTGLLSRGLRPEESASYFAILNHAKGLSLAQQKVAAKQFERQRRTVVQDDPEYQFYFRQREAPFPTFVDLHRCPEEYHGQLVTLTGHLRRLLTFHVEPNPAGFQQLHEAWLYVDDAQQNPVVIVCSDLPPNIPTGTDVVVDQVSVTGYFFKRYGYADRSGQSRFAPLLLAYRLEWKPRPTTKPWITGSTGFGFVIAIAAIVSATWFFCRSTIRTSH